MHRRALPLQEREPAVGAERKGEESAFGREMHQRHLWPHAGAMMFWALRPALVDFLIQDDIADTRIHRRVALFACDQDVLRGFSGF